MNLRIAMAIALGGAFGAVARFYISGLLPVYGGDFPVGTLMVNSIASLILGYLYGLLFWGFDVPPDWRAFFGTGFCGALSTFSTFSYETFSLLREREYLIATLNILANVIITIALVFAGFMLARR
ncbi:fluoride efflux transporter CrcB [Thermococcus sp. JCM 11816]|uniref:fluoride efflux transporter CrcB n=1 Tax=Thermococcus sp. (strain JCM 11816 / KS-1) TaxID=1295125 RepID=UPI0006D0DCCA